MLSWSEAGCTGKEAGACMNVAACSAAPPPGSSCELDYALCLRSQGCPADMFSFILKDALAGSIYIAQPKNEVCGESAASAATFDPSSCGVGEFVPVPRTTNSTSLANTIKRHLPEDAGGGDGGSGNDAVEAWAALALDHSDQRRPFMLIIRLNETAPETANTPTTTPSTLLPPAAMVVWVPGLVFSLTSAATKWQPLTTEASPTATATVTTAVATAAATTDSATADPCALVAEAELFSASMSAIQQLNPGHNRCHQTPSSDQEGALLFSLYRGFRTHLFECACGLKPSNERENQRVGGGNSSSNNESSSDWSKSGGGGGSASSGGGSSGGLSVVGSSHGAHHHHQHQHHSVVIVVPVRVVSLLRRARDRWQWFVRSAHKQGLLEHVHFRRHQAVDGQQLSANDPRLVKFFVPPPLPPLPLPPLGAVASASSASPPSTTSSSSPLSSAVTSSLSSSSTSSSVAVPPLFSGAFVRGHSGGVVGCALSHVALWQELVEAAGLKVGPSMKPSSSSPSSSLSSSSSSLASQGEGGEEADEEKAEENQAENVAVTAAEAAATTEAAATGADLMVVLEDDAVLLVGVEELSALVGSLASSGFDGVAMLGFHARQQPSALEAWELSTELQTQQQQQQQRAPPLPPLRVAPLPKASFLGGTFAYVVSAKQAKRYLEVLLLGNETPVEGGGQGDGDGRFDQVKGTFAVDHFMRAHTEDGRWWGVSPLRVAHSDFAYKSRLSGEGDTSSSAPDSDIAIAT